VFFDGRCHQSCFGRIARVKISPEHLICYNKTIYKKRERKIEFLKDQDLNFWNDQAMK
jgi:hypothetical protein